MISWINNNIGKKNFIVLSIVLLCIVGFLIGPALNKKMKAVSYGGTAKAEVTDIVVKKSAFQHLNGTSEKITGYEVTYRYKSESKDYTNTEIIMPGSDVKSLFDEFTSGATCYIEVRYSLKTPSESIISKLNMSK